MPGKPASVRLLPARFKTLTLALLCAAAGCLLGFLLLVPGRHVFALAFGGLLLSVAWRSLADLLIPRRALPRVLAVALVFALGCGLWMGLGLWIGPQLAEQFENLGARLHEAFEAGRRVLGGSETGRMIERRWPEIEKHTPGGSLMVQLWNAVSAGFGALGDALIIFFVGLFLAINPRVYRRGLLHLVPRARRARVAEVMQRMGTALRRWLLARAILMLLVGVVFGAGLWILGVPLALPLGLIAGVLEFVPYIGPITAMFPALAVALMEGPRLALYVAVLYVITQLLESYVGEPLIEGRTLSLPPGLIILFQVICGLWLGVLGVVIATPLLVVVMVAVQMLYVQDALGDPMAISGQPGEKAESALPQRPAHGRL